MKRIAFLVCGLLLLISNTAEARRNRWNNGGNYVQPVQVYRPVLSAPAGTAVPQTSDASDEATSESEDADATTSDTVVRTSATSATTPAPVRQVSYSTSTAQGVANLMAANNRVGHWGGNPGYEGCGCGATPAAAYAICCYGNSGMATVDVGYAQASNGMWYCCRRYR
jgi:hypothetical protein